MTGKFDEYCVWTDDESSLDELDAENFGQSVRERVDVAVHEKAKRQITSIYFYDIIEETADNFLCEGQKYEENKARFGEIKSAYHELLPAFQILRGYVKDDQILDGAIRDVMWNSFLIGLACDRERLENPEILEKYTSSVTEKARIIRSEKYDKWIERVYNALILALPVAINKDKNFQYMNKTSDYAKDIFEYVAAELEKTKSDDSLVWKTLTTNAVRTAVGLYIDNRKGGRL